MSTYTMTGQIRGGKNNICITKSGHRYPNKEWAAWRDTQVYSLKAQRSDKTLDMPCFLSVDYVASNKQRRDIPAILDAIMHCLEKSGIVADDALIKHVYIRTGYDKDNPRATLKIYPMETLPDMYDPKEV